MSQTNSFQKSNNPNYVYFDLQQTNAYNNVETNPQSIPSQLRFVETRDSPIVPNSGDYAMSVLRFQVDTYALPVLVVEPEIQTPFNFQETIHKVGIRAKKINLRADALPNLISLGASANHTVFRKVIWNPEDPSLQPPAADGALTGKNTVEYPYYHCHSYDRFVNCVNVALRNVYVDIINYLWSTFLPTVNPGYIDPFLHIFLQHFPVPGALKWSNFTAEMVINILFATSTLEFDINYDVPGVNFNVVGPNLIGTFNNPVPFNFELLMNASLFSLFNTFPARETTINNEKFFILDFNFPNITPLGNGLAIPKYIPFAFDVLPYYNAATNTYTIPMPGSSAIYDFPYSDKFFTTSQEMSTIDTWCPINSIVFTSSTLPIIVNQASARTTRNFEVPRSEVNNEFELIITDFQTNQQGFRPNVLYTPTSEYRRIDMTGNTPINIIDIAVLWRARTGQLMPFYLPRGGSASLKILFEKKSLEQMK